MKKIVLFGVGRRFSIAYPWIRDSFFEIIDIWDNDEKKYGQGIDGYEICMPSEKYIGMEVEIIITNTYFKEIKNQLIQMGYDESHIHNVWWIYSFRVMHFYNNCNAVVEPSEKQALDRIKKKGLTTLNIDFSKNYEESEIISGFDRNNGMHYIMHNGNKLYLTPKYKREEGIRHYNELRKEQDINSPHYYGKYISSEKYDCVVDGGCCEGIFALDIAKKCEELILVEPDKGWIDTYQYTFEDYNELKINVFPQALGRNEDAKKYITLDTILKKYLKSKKRILIKIDIEGAEEDVLEGASQILSSENEMTVIACAYHHADADVRIAAILKKYGFKVCFSKRNMFFRPEYEVDTVNLSDDFIKKTDLNFRLRHGLVVGYKNRKGW